jgi:hypothetical protein
VPSSGKCQLDSLARKWDMGQAATGNVRFFSLAEADHILLQLLHRRHAGLHANAISSSKVWLRCKRLAQMK